MWPDRDGAATSAVVRSPVHSAGERTSASGCSSVGKCPASSWAATAAAAPAAASAGTSARLRVSVAKLLPFVVTTDHRPRLLDSAGLRDRLVPGTAFAHAAKPAQLSLF
jgi:hypothetical protein